MKSSPSSWRYTVKLTVNIVSIFVTFLENMNFKEKNTQESDFAPESEKLSEIKTPLCDFWNTLISLYN